MENLFTPNCIRTFTGKYVNVFDPDPETICIEDIAHALSFQCRFGGHMPVFYTVAQHSILCSKQVIGKFKLEALMHDASEAYLLDIPSPVKKGLSNYKDIEDRLMMIIALKFGFTWPVDKCVKDIDSYTLKLEWNEMVIKEPSKISFYVYPPNYAELEFLDLFYSLTK